MLGNHVKNGFRLFVLLIICGVVASGCLYSRSQKGVNNFWRKPHPQTFQKGKTTMSDVFSALGPPSQIISLKNQQVFYYLLEEEITEAFFLGIYNQRLENTVFDRAIFFFDRKGILEEYSLSQEKIKYKAQNEKKK